MFDRVDSKEVRSPDQKEEKNKQVDLDPAAISLLPLGVIAKLSEFMTVSDIAAFSVVNRSATEHLKNFWAEKINQDFKHNIPEAKGLLNYGAIYRQLLKALKPSNHSAIYRQSAEAWSKLPNYSAIYRQLKAWSKLPRRIQRQFNNADPALFQEKCTDVSDDYIDRYDYLRKAALVGNLALVKSLILEEKDDKRPVLDQNTLYCAARSGSLELVKYLMEYRAARSGSLELVKYLIEYWATGLASLGLVKHRTKERKSEKPFVFDQKALDMALRSGSLELVEYLEKKGEVISKQVLTRRKRLLDLAIDSGSLKVVRLIDKLGAKNGQPPLAPDQNMLCRAARSGSLELVKGLRLDAKATGRDLVLDQRMLFSAVESGSLELVKELMLEAKATGQDLVLDQYILSIAVESGNLELVEELMLKAKATGQDFVLNETILHSALKVGSLLLVGWLISTERGSQRLVLDQYALHFVASSGNLELMILLTESGKMGQRFVPDLTAFEQAVCSGNLKLVRHLINKVDIGSGRRLVFDQNPLDEEAQLDNPGLVPWVEQQLAVAQRLEAKEKESKEHKGVSTVSTMAAPLAASSRAPSSALFPPAGAVVAPEAPSPATRQADAGCAIA